MPALKQRSVWSYFMIPTLAFFAAIAVAGWQGGLTLAYTVGFLAILEVSLSFDNAVVNAHILQHWDEKWKKLFLGIGIIIAVFGMRFLFPILIVAVAAHMAPTDVLTMAFTDPNRYGATLTSVHHLVAAFGGTFLLLVGLEYFLNQEKENHWLGPIEKVLNKFGLMTMAEAVIAVAVLLLLTPFVGAEERLAYLTAGLVGLVLFSLTKTLGTIASGGGDMASKVIKAGIGGFIYLEVLDASFSFDGVIGAFALTNNIIWIMTGLGVGALAVRELTLLAVDRGTLAEFPHLEMGAFWAILALAGMMLIGPIYELPEIIKGLCGAGFIGAAFITSLLANRAALAQTVAAE
jgi:hypothetical protein